MSDLQLTNVINVSVSNPQSGIGTFNTSNLSLFSREVPADSFGTDGYKIYLDPSDVETDFGTDSPTFAMANAVFSQNPNILRGKGYLVIILMQDTVDAVTEIQTVSFSAVSAAGDYRLKYGLVETADIASGSNAATVQAALRLVAGLAAVTVTGSEAAGFVVTFAGVVGDAALLVVDHNSLQDAGGFDVVVTAVETVKGVDPATPETIAAAVSRTQDLVQYFGVLLAEISTQVDMLAGAAVINGLRKIAFWASRTAADVEPGGRLDLLRSGTMPKNRGIFYGSDNDTDCLVMVASYAGRALSVDFTGSNTTETMHLKSLIGVQPDPSMTQTLLSKCKTAGVDTYVSLQGVPKTFTSGANQFFDRIYNQQAFVAAIEVAGFNAMAQADTKLPQTEDGVSVLTGAYRQVCEQFKNNEYVAPGTWNSATTFGNLSDFHRNIGERGYYIYSQPIAQQLQADRDAREAPLAQIALKEAGAIHSASVIININA